MNSAIHEIICSDEKTKSIINELYRQSIFTRYERPIYRSNGSKGNWGLDFRIPFSNGRFITDISLIYASTMKKLGISQVVSIGCAGTLLAAGIVSTNKNFRCGIIRKERKRHGFREIVEGSLEKDEPLIIVDDILSSGKTILRAIEIIQLEGYKKPVIIPMVAFGWGKGIKRLSQLEYTLLPLSTLMYSENYKKEKMKVRWKTQNSSIVSWPQRQ